MPMHFAVRSLLLVLALVLALPAAATAAVETHGDHIPPTADSALRATVSQAGEVALVPASIPTTWCGTARTTDYTGANQQGSGAMVKVIYAYAHDQPNHFVQYADKLQSDAGVIADAYALATDGAGQKTVRFDLGNDGGPDCLDILTAQLPQDLQHYTDLTDERDRLAA